ncbi:MAG: sugar kinase [Dictyoglomus sp. NZ13-RE01]|nr:MAG: sugar kinase [Dictyoglomus sp. NZ13-RE01]
MSLKNLLTIDLGTTNIKIFLWNKKGKIISKKVIPTQISSDYSISPNFIKEAIYNTLREMPLKSIGGISVSGMGEAGLLIDEEGKPLTNIFSWLDLRGEKELNILNSINKERIFEITGLKVSPKYSLAKILWVRENQKDIWSRVWKWLNAVDFVNYLLTGEVITDYSLASRMLIFDIRNKYWSKEILNLCGLNESILPNIKACGSYIGDYNTIPVFLGGHDHPIGSFPLELDYSTLYDSWGTAEAFFLLSDNLNILKDVGKKGFSVGCLLEDRYYLLGGIHFSGGIYNWIRNGLNIKRKIERINFQFENELFFFPYILGRNIPSPNKDAKGMFFGITIKTTLNDLLQSIWEGLFFETRLIIEEIRNIGFNIEKIILGGGMCRFKNIVQLKADILNTPLFVSKERELTSKGTAYLIANNIYPKNYAENFKVKEFTLYEPINKLDYYEEKFKKYKELLQKFYS